MDFIIDNIKTLMGGLVAILLAAIGAALKDGKLIRKVFESWLTPHTYGTYKRENPRSHPIFIVLHDYMTVKNHIPEFDQKKQEIYEIYSRSFYQIFYKELQSFVKVDHSQQTKHEFELSLMIWFNEMTEKAYTLINKRLAFPEHVKTRMARFQQKQQISFKEVLNVWLNDKRFEGIKNGNETQLYSIMNDMQSQLTVFRIDVREYFTDLNGKLGENTKIIA